jgi:hypothetical protein
MNVQIGDTVSIHLIRIEGVDESYYNKVSSARYTVEKVVPNQLIGVRTYAHLKDVKTGKVIYERVGYLQKEA